MSLFSGLPGSLAALDLRQRSDVRHFLLHAARPPRHPMVLPRQEYGGDIQGGKEEEEDVPNASVLHVLKSNFYMASNELHICESKSRPSLVNT